MLKIILFLAISLLGTLSFALKTHAQDETTIIEKPTLPQLQGGDSLRLYVYGDDDLTGEYRIDPRGMLTLPLIGEVDTNSLNKSQLEQKIAQALIDGGYYNDPKVTIDVAIVQPFYILGEVKTPGSYPYTADLDLFKAVAIAGGYTPRADKEDIVIIRKENGERVTIKADENTEILPGDSIKVEQRFF